MERQANKGQQEGLSGRPGESEGLEAREEREGNKGYVERAIKNGLL